MSPALSRLTLRSSRYLVLIAVVSALAFAASPGDKRTILTSGEKVHIIHYQLGQSTILYFGTKPETVICGNKNYFNIEKIKEGLTIQPLSNFSTNLAVLNQGKRFLFFLRPAKNGQEADTFIDVRWIPEADARQVAGVAGNAKESVLDLNQKMSLGALDLLLKREIQIDIQKRSIVEFTVKNTGKAIVKTSEIEILGIKGGRPFDHQISVFEQDEIKPAGIVTGRLIVTNADLKKSTFVANYLGKAGKIQLSQGGNH